MSIDQDEYERKEQIKRYEIKINNLKLFPQTNKNTKYIQILIKKLEKEIEVLK